MDLALNDLQRLICHKTQPTNQPTNPISWLYILVVCIRVSSSFSFFANSVHKVINIFLQFTKFVAPSAFLKNVTEWHHCY